jgi:ferredoxin
VKVSVDAQRCQGHTLCAMRAPKTFDLDEVDGHAVVIGEQVPTDQEEQVAEAARSCPEQAITLS